MRLYPWILATSFIPALALIAVGAHKCSAKDPADIGSEARTNITFAAVESNAKVTLNDLCTIDREGNVVRSLRFAPLSCGEYRKVTTCVVATPTPKVTPTRRPTATPTPVRVGSRRGFVTDNEMVTSDGWITSGSSNNFFTTDGGEWNPAFPPSCADWWGEACWRLDPVCHGGR